MKGKYKAAFILPVGASRMLSENGWEFETQNKINMKVKDLLINELKLEFLESYLQIDCYLNEEVKMSISYDDQKQIECIYFQIYNETLTTLTNLFINSWISNESELFIPGNS